MKKLLVMKPFLWALLLFLALPQTASAYHLSVYLDPSGAAAYEADFTGSGTERTATVIIDDYTGNASNYWYRVSDGQTFNDDKSPYFNLGASNSSLGSVSPTDHISSSCGAGAVMISVSIYTNSGDKNWYPHNVSCTSVEGCRRLDGGDDPITAGTVVYFDNSKEFFPNVYMSVSSASNAGLVEPSRSYVPKNDDWYPMELVEGSNGIYKATVTANNSNGRVSFWSADLSQHNEPWQGNAFFNIPFDADNTYYVPSVSTSPSNPDPSDWCWQSDRKVNYSTKGEWKSEPDIVASYIYSETFYVDAEEESFTLKAYLMGERTPLGYRWDARQEDGTEWTEIETTPAPELTINKADFPVGNMVYRVVVLTSSGDPVESLNTWRIAFASTCDGETSSVVVFEQNFGTGPSYRYRVPESEVSADIPDTYTYREDSNEKINDGQMAIVADPYWCGCGDGKDMTESIDECMPEDRNPDEGKGSSNWYRAYVYPTAGFPEADRIKFRDHTINEQSDNASKYGLCLLINYADNINNLAYQHILTPEEKAEMVPGSKVRLTAHIASIAKYWSEQQAKDGVEMTISIDFKGASEADWRTLVSAKKKVWHHNNWYPIVTEEFTLGDEGEGDYRIRIYSSEHSGIGHDIVIDDIRLVACQPVIRNYLEYVDGSGQTQQSDDVTMQKHDDEFTLVVPEFDTGLLGKDPQVMLFVYDEGEYTYIGDLEYDAGRYTINVSKSYMGGSSEVHHFETVPDQVQFVTVATTKEADKDKLASDIKSGAIDPVNSTACYRSENIITLRTDCKAAPVISIAEGSSAYICAENPMAYPDVKIEFDNFTDEVQYKITSTQSGDNGATVSSEWIDVTADELSKGELTAALNGMAEWSWQAGQSYTVSVSVKEFFTGSAGRVETCERSAASGVTFHLRPLPGLTTELQDTEMCRGQEDKQITAVVNANTNTYLWQVSKDNGTTWTAAEGTNNSSTYTIPSTAENGWQYRLQLSYVSQTYTCGPVTTDPLTLTVSDCEDYQLSQTITTPSGDGVCPGESFTVTWTIKNLSQVTTQLNVELTANAWPEGVQTPTWETAKGTGSYNAETRVATWNVGEMEPNSSYTITWTYGYEAVESRVENLATPAQVWISQSNSEHFATYEDQTTGSWRDYDNLLLKAKSPEPVSNLTAEGYVACATEGTLDLTTLVSANGTQTWYSDQTLTQVVANTQLDANQAIRTTYYVTNTVEGQCESDAVPVPVWIKEISATPIVNTGLVNEEGVYEICASGTSQTMELSTLLAGTYENLTWYSDEALQNEVPDPVIDLSQPTSADNAYWVVNTETDKCPSEAVKIGVYVKEIPASPSVIDADGDGYAYNECATAGANIDLSSLVQTGAGTLQWYDEAGNILSATSFNPDEPMDRTYKASVIVNGCESATVDVKVRVVANSSALTTTSAVSEDGTFATCQATGSSILAWSDLIAAPHGVLNWYSDDDLQNPVPEPQVDLSVAQDVTYYVTNTEDGLCESLPVLLHIVVNAVPSAPVAAEDPDNAGYAYNECASAGSKDLSELASSYEGTLAWYDAAGNPLTETSFDTGIPGETTYLASSISADGCESAKAEVRVRIVANSAVLSTTSQVSADGTFATCQTTSSSILSWADLIAEPHGTLTWYSDEALQNQIAEPQIDLSVAQDVTYYVTNTEDGLCESLPVLLHIVVNAVPSAPVAAEDPDNAGYAYSECASAGSKSLSELIVSHDGTLQWYDAAGNPLGTGASFDTSEAGETTYYASSISADGCESAKAEVKVRVVAAGVAPDVLDYNECAQEGSYNLDNLATTPQGTLEWFGDASATQLLSPATFDMAQVGNHTYYVRATASGECHSGVVPVSVVIRDVATASDISVDDLDVCPGAEATLTASTSMDDENMVFTWYSDAELGNSIGTGATLQITGPEAQATYYVTVKGDNTCENLPGDAAEADVYAIAPIDNIRLEPVEERIGMGKETEKALTVEPTDAYYTAVWTANGQVIADPDSYFPAKPYSDVEYKVVVTDECGNEMEASAITKVVWPTIITPQNADGKNDDFLVGMQEDIHLEIFDRWGNVVFSGNDGWSQAEAAKQQPGVYYYIATLPDGTAKQGTIEVYK